MMGYAGYASLDDELNTYVEVDDRKLPTRRSLLRDPVVINVADLPPGDYTLENGKVQRLFRKSPTLDDAKQELLDALMEYFDPTCRMPGVSLDEALNRLKEARADVVELELDLDAMDELEGQVPEYDL